MTDVFVTIDGSVVPWKALSVSRSLDAFVGSCLVSLPLTPEVPIRPGGRIRIAAHGLGNGVVENLLSGFVDSVEVSRSASSQEVQIQARDRTADLVDSARVESDLARSYCWHNSTLLQVARDLVLPYQLRVLDEVGAGAMPIKAHLGQPGESAFAVLERAARLHGVLIGTSPAGAVVLGQPRGERVEVGLSMGQHGRVKSYTLSNDASGRYSRYSVLAYSGLDGLAVGTPPIAVAEDQEVRGQRTKVIIAQGSLSGDEIAALANWHATIARARSARLGLEVVGWRSVPRGPVWRPGMQVSVSLPELGLDDSLLVAGVDLSIDDGGEVANLSLTRRDAYEVDPSERIRLRQNLGGVV